jgi:dihydrodipicolinate synthase/N-acetylneuraminate lyase
MLILVIYGICREGTLEAIEHAKDAQAAGADGMTKKGGI